VTRGALVVGFGASGEAVAGRLRQLGFDVVACDDTGGDEMRRRAAAAGVALEERPDGARLAELVAAAELVVPSPGVPAHHPVFALTAAAGTAVESELGLAADAIDVPIVAITGTNGKTTVTTLVAEMLVASGMRAIAAGNIGTPLTTAVGQRVDVVVAEVSSFQLQLAPRFHPRVGVWLNLAPDHLDWHGSDESYAAAKFRVWENQGADDVAVANADDPGLEAWAAKAPGRVVRYGIDEPAEYSVAGGELVGPDGETIVAVGELWRALPHDLGNSLAASAAALAGGASLDGVRAALRAFRGLPHRLALVGDADGVRWYDDSKATNPHAAAAAIRSFESVVLIAGGQNKGLDLAAMAEGADRVRGVVAIGAAGDQVRDAFERQTAVVTAESMDAAVEAAGDMARPGDAVLLSPGCASFDWYVSYAERGDDFARAVGERLAAAR
jgi:UDP-N-acetylmuramoylalanine--D-glutamate ligase